MEFFDPEPIKTHRLTSVAVSIPLAGCTDGRDGNGDGGTTPTEDGIDATPTEDGIEETPTEDEIEEMPKRMVSMKHLMATGSRRGAY